LAASCARFRRAVLVLLLPILAGCASGPSWVTRSGGPVDTLHELRCDEFVMQQNGPRFTGFEYSDRNKCMRAHGYVRPWEVAP